MGLVVIVVVLVFLHGKKEKNESTGMSFDACTCKEMCMSCPWSHVSYLLSSFLMIYYLVKMQGERAEREREKPNFSIGCSTLQSINNRTPFFLIIVTIVIYAAVQYCSGDLVFVCGRMCVCVYVCAYIHTHKCKGKRVKKKKTRAACGAHTHKRIANARGKKEKIVELILRRRTPYKNSVLYVRYVLNERERERERKKKLSSVEEKKTEK